MLGNAIEVMTQFLSGVPLNTAAGSSTASEGQRKIKEISSTASEGQRKTKEISSTASEGQRKIKEISSTASEGQRKSKEISSTASEDQRKTKEISYCVQCEVYCEGVEQYTVHIASRKHRKRVAGIARREGNKRRKEECDLSCIDTVWSYFVDVDLFLTFKVTFRNCFTCLYRGVLSLLAK